MIVIRPANKNAEAHYKECQRHIEHLNRLVDEFLDNDAEVMADSFAAIAYRYYRLKDNAAAYLN